MISRLCTGKSKLYSDMTDMCNAKVDRLNQFARSSYKLLHESVEIDESLINQAEPEEFKSWIINLSNNIRETDSISDEAMLSIIKAVETMANMAISENDKSMEDVYSGLVNLIEVIVSNKQLQSNNMTEYVHKLNQIVTKLRYVIERIGEEPETISPKEIDDLIENSGNLVSENLRDNIGKLFLNPKLSDNPETYNLEVSETISLTEEIIEECISDGTELSSGFINKVLLFAYNKLILHVSALRRIGELLEDMANELPEDSPIKDSLTSWSERFNKRAGDTFKNCPNYDYDVITELGYDYIYNNYPDDVWSNFSSNPLALNEGAMKDNTKKIVTKVNRANRVASRKVDSKVQRIIDDYRQARKDRMEDKLVKSTFAASYHLKNMLKAGLVALIPQIGPSIALIYLIVKFAVNKHTEGKYKQRLLNDLKEELRIVEEKVRDADSAGDNQSKYKLMRLESQLKRAIDTIQYNLKTRG